MSVLDELAGLEDRAIDVRLGGEVDDVVGRLDQRRRDGRVGDVAVHEGVARVRRDAVQVLAAARVGELVERRHVPVGVRGERMAHEVAADEAGAAGDEDVGHVRRSQTAARSASSCCAAERPGRALADAEGAEDVRERADAGQRERDVEAAILRDDEPADVRIVERLVLDADAAALRIVEEADALLHQGACPTG